MANRNPSPENRFKQGADPRRWKKGKQKIEKFEDLVSEGDREMVYKAAIRGAKKGNHALIRELLDRFFGKVTTPVDIETNQPIQFIISKDNKQAVDNVLKSLEDGEGAETD